MEELTEDYGRIPIHILEEKYDASYSTLQRVLKKYNLIKGNKNYKYKYIHDNIDEFKKDYIDGILNDDQLKEKYKCPITCYYSLARDLNIKRKRIIEKIDVDELLNDWKSKKLYDYEICEKYHISHTTLLNILSKNNIEDVGKRYGRKDYFNEKYFDNIDSEHKAYWLGFIYADGCHNEQRYSLNITLKEEDAYILEEFLKDIGSNKKVYKIFNKQYNRYYANVHVQHPHLSKSLLGKGVSSDKSFKIIFPDNNIVPYKYKWHFIRGYFDGDGGISISKNSLSKINLSMVGNYIFLLGMKNFIESEISNYTININKHSNVYKINKGGRFVVETLLNYIYKDSTIHLKRKYNKYQEILVLNQKKEEDKC